MKLNRMGRAAMNSPLRALAQSYVASWLERLGGRVEGGRVLELGCGGGAGVRILLERFGAAQVEAIDLDPKMIERARQRFSSEELARVHLSVGDATSLNAPDTVFDAVFDFGAIHLERNWRQAVAEVARVLKPGGRFFFELVTSRALRLSYPLLTQGLARMEPPNSDLFLEELQRHGIVVGRSFVRPRLAALTGWVGDLVGVGWVEGAGQYSGALDAIPSGSPHEVPIRPWPTESVAPHAILAAFRRSFGETNDAICPPG